MILCIDTTKDNDISVALKYNERQIIRKKVSAKYSQAEKLLPLIYKILKEKKFSLKDIKKIQVNNSGGSFTALRIGIVTANALGFALKIPVSGKVKNKKLKIKSSKFNIIEPIYNKEPNITKSKK